MRKPDIRENLRRRIQWRCQVRPPPPPRARTTAGASNSVTASAFALCRMLNFRSDSASQKFERPHRLEVPRPCRREIMLYVPNLTRRGAPPLSCPEAARPWPTALIATNALPDRRQRAGSELVKAGRVAETACAYACATVRIGCDIEDDVVRVGRVPCEQRGGPGHGGQVV